MPGTPGGTCVAPTPFVPLAVTSGTVESLWVSWNAACTSNVHLTTTTSAVSDATVWAVWQTPVTVTASTSTAVTAWAQWNAIRRQTAEQHRRGQQAARRRLQAAERERRSAYDRALELLGMVLTPGQMASYHERGFFEVRSSKGRWWRIRARGQAGNVDLMPEIGEEREATYCAHPPGGVPDPDAHLAQALQLVTDEDEFLSVANCHYRRTAARAA